jgi:recombination protein RecT
MSTQLATLKQTLNGEAMREQFARALPKHLSPERFCRIAITALTRTPKLADCTQESLMKCLLDLSAFGLEPDGRRAHLIPYKDQCTLVIDWKGLAELAMRSGIIAKLHADIVCENDVFSYNLGEITRHEIDFRKPRGDMYAAYALAQTKTGEVFVAVLSKDEIDAVRKRSRSGSSGPWVTDYAEMAKKTAFRRLSKWLPLSAEFRDAQELDDEPEQIRDVTPKATESKLFKSLKPEDCPQHPPYKSLVNQAETADSPATTYGDGASQATQNESAESFILSDEPVLLVTQVASEIYAAGLKWSEVHAVMADNGLADSEFVPLNEAPSDVLTACLAQFDAIVKLVKGVKP